jgi:hypothetical protein
VYLCQVNRRVSCGACCGLYNMAGLSRPKLEERLVRRARRFVAIPRTEDRIDQFRHDQEGWTPEERPFPRFYACPFLGLIGKHHTRVGCLLHPDAPGNQGRDFRYLSYYGAQACASYLCPASRTLRPRHLQILRTLFHDWFPYGLIITEQRLLEAVFGFLEIRLGRPLGPEDFAVPSAAAAGLRDLLGLKLSWPYREAHAPGPCHYPFDNGLYDRPPVRWPSSFRPGYPYDILFQELESHFGAEADVVEAQALLASRLTRIVNGLGARGA